MPHNGDPGCSYIGFCVISLVAIAALVMSIIGVIHAGKSHEPAIDSVEGINDLLDVMNARSDGIELNVDQLSGNIDAVVDVISATSVDVVNMGHQVDAATLQSNQNTARSANNAISADANAHGVGENAAQIIGLLGAPTMQPCSGNAQCPPTSGCVSYTCMQTGNGGSAFCVSVLAAEGSACITVAETPGLCSSDGLCVFIDECHASIRAENELGAKLVAAYNSRTGIDNLPDIPNNLHWTTGLGYQLQVPSFNDGNCGTQGIGDICGVTQVLDTLFVELGITYIWLTQPTQGGHWWGFDTLNHSVIAAGNGDLDDVRTLVCEAHARDIKIMMGLVHQHVGSDHEFFQRALANETEYLPYFHLTTNPPSHFFTISAGGNAWVKVSDIFPTSVLGQDPDNVWWYRHIFGPFTPGIDVGYAPWLEHSCAVARHWADNGIDGFRLDAITSNQPDTEGDVLTRTDQEVTSRFYEQFFKCVRATHPDIHIVIEREEPHNVKSYGPSFFDKRMSTFLSNVIHGAADVNFNNYMTTVLPVQVDRVTHFFQGNHDTARLLATIPGVIPVGVNIFSTPPAGAALVAPGSGTLRVHIPTSGLTAFLENNLRLFYHNFDGIASLPWPFGAPLPDDTPADLLFLGGDHDPVGAYWDFSMASMPFDVISLSLLQGDGYVYAWQAPVVLGAEIVAQIAANGGDVFIEGVDFAPAPITGEALDRMKCVYAIELTLPGTPQIWQGDELSTLSRTYDDPQGTRDPYIWSEAGATATHFNPSFDSGISATPYNSPISNAVNVVPYSVQRDDPNSQYSYIATLGRYRRDNAVLREGAIVPMPIPGDRDNDAFVFCTEETCGDNETETHDEAGLYAYARYVGRFPFVTIVNSGPTTHMVEYRPRMLRDEAGLAVIMKNVNEFVDFLGQNPSSGTPRVIQSHNIDLVYDGSDLSAEVRCDPILYRLHPYSSLLVHTHDFWGLAGFPPAPTVAVPRFDCPAPTDTVKVETLSAVAAIQPTGIYTPKVGREAYNRTAVLGLE